MNESMSALVKTHCFKQDFTTRIQFLDIQHAANFADSNILKKNCTKRLQSLMSSLKPTDSNFAGCCKQSERTAASKRLQTVSPSNSEASESIADSDAHTGSDNERTAAPRAQVLDLALHVLASLQVTVN